jgi:hypothetical protein
MSTLIWFNEDGLNPDHLMVQEYTAAPKVYIFDVPYLQEWKITKHRVQFIYETLLEIPEVQIYKGETLAILSQLVSQYQVQKIVTTETPNHIIQSWQRQIQQQVKLVAYPKIYPVKATHSPRRFSRYWNKFDRAWLTPSVTVISDR